MSFKINVHALLHFGGGFKFEYIMNETNKHCQNLHLTFKNESLIRERERNGKRYTDRTETHTHTHRDRAAISPICAHPVEQNKE